MAAHASQRNWSVAGINESHPSCCHRFHRVRLKGPSIKIKKTTSKQTYFALLLCFCSEREACVVGVDSVTGGL